VSARRRLALAALAACLPLAAAGAQTHVLIVSGLGGDKVFSARFNRLSHDLATALHQRVGIPAADVVWVGEDSSQADSSYAGRSTRENIEAQFARLTARTRPGSQVVLVLMGHGAGDGTESRLNIPGPDLTGRDYARLLGAFANRRVAVLDLTSASGDMLAVLSAPDRVVITATRTALERNESRFATYFVKAFAEDVADTDKDGRVSLLEAFRYASAETKRLYDKDTKLQTEHAQLDDDGDRQGSTEPDGRTGEGRLARRFFLDATVVATRAGATDARLPALYGEKFALEEEVEALKTRKAKMAATAYSAELERVLIALARKAREIRAIEGAR